MINDYEDPYIMDNTYHPGQWIYKDFNIDLDDSVWKEIDKIRDGIWYYNFKNEEDKMSLTKRLQKTSLDENEKLALELGAQDEDGALTESGKDLLLNLLLTDKDIYNKFVDALRKIKESDGE